jgi:hypothetical protein
VIRIRAADDFAAIRARMEELRPARPRAADDFVTIRSRMEELRRERAQLLAEAGGRSLVGPRPYHRAASSEIAHESRRLLPRLIRRRLLG